MENIRFDSETTLASLESMSAEQLDDLDFGVIAMRQDGVVEAYNRYESERAGLSRALVIGKNFFSEVAPCTNNYLVSGRFEEHTLDVSLPYVFTLRMRPKKVQLRLLKSSTARLQYILVSFLASQA